MGRTAKKVAMVNGRRMRITRLDACGRIVYGDDNVVVSNGFITAKITTNTTSTSAVNVTNANGEPIVQEPATTSFSSFTVSLDFAEVDPELFALITGQAVKYDAFGNPYGFSIDSSVSLTGQGVALEIWTGSPSGDACDTIGAQGSFGYILLPFLQGGVIGDLTVAAGGITFTVNNMVTVTGNHWGFGPYLVDLGVNGNPSKLPESVKSTEHEVILNVAVAPPEATVGTRPQLDPAAASVTAISFAAGTDPHEVELTVTGAGAGVGVWYDFGDGSWDYLTGAEVSHVYDAAGDYTVTASSNGTWITKTVTAG